MADALTTRRAAHPVTAIGIALTTISALLFVFLWALEAFGLLRNPYIGLVAFIAVPALFVIGLLLIPLGVWLKRRRVRHGLPETQWPILDFAQPRARRIALIVLLATVVNVLIVSVAGYEAVHWMESPSFCGQVCHTPMEPHFVQWRQAPHANIACVDCHVGSGAEAFVQAKLNGMRQLAGVMTGRYARPIPSPVHNMRPAEFTCAQCHWASRYIGERTKVIREYADDETNSETQTILRLRVGTGGDGARPPSGIHWHTGPGIEIDYVAGDPKRETIPYVRVKDRQGRVREFVAEGVDAKTLTGERRRMDCIDCHSRPAHPFAYSPERAVDAAIGAGRVNRSLPFVRRETVKALKVTNDDKAAALEAVARSVRDFYKSSYPEVMKTSGADVDRAVALARETYDRYIFPSMKVTWGTYASHLGHVDTPGCFRCHDESHKASDGTVIRQDCELCHTQLEAPASP